MDRDDSDRKVGDIALHEDPRFVLRPHADKILRVNAEYPERHVPLEAVVQSAHPTDVSGDDDAAWTDVPTTGSDGLRQWLGLVAALLAFVPLLQSIRWFIRDFTRLSLTSPNLDKATQVADFDDLGYIGGYLTTHHFRPGILAALLAVSLLVLAVNLYQTSLRARQIYWLGGIALVQVMILQWLDYEVVNFVLALFVGVILWLTTEWEGGAGHNGAAQVGKRSTGRAGVLRALSFVVRDRLVLLFTIAATLVLVLMIPA